MLSLVFFSFFFLVIQLTERERCSQSKTLAFQMAGLLDVAYRIALLCLVIHAKWNPDATDVGVARGNPNVRIVPPTVHTKHGSIVGKQVELLDKRINVFSGIPYAQAPVGDLRLRKPVPYPPWNVTLNATRRPHQCRQNPHEWPPLPGKSSNCSEDCLYLNVWAPADVVPGELRAVMVWIHGGDFILGSSSWDYYDGSMLAAYGEVVVVSMNYRLGRLGFLNAGSDQAPGNQGLYDQNLALQWVRDNIFYFGGNESAVTLFGQDAGAASIAMHMMSPVSSGLFKRAIMQSGGAFWKLRESSMWSGHVPLGTKAVKKARNCTARTKNK